MKNFVITGVAGYIVPRHLRAIKETGNRLVAALDPHDAVGVLDSYFYEASYFREFERLDRHVDKLHRKGDADRIHYVSICSPNYLHDAHIRFALRVGADAICEKPLVLNPWNLDALEELENETGRHVNSILQLRLHPSIRALKETLVGADRSRKHNIVLSYIATRGNWYLHSWKGDKEKSGGLTSNIGIHFFDMLIWLFGPVQHSEVHVSEAKKEAGYLELRDAHVRWFVSIDRDDLPAPLGAAPTTHRSITIDDEELEFSSGFTDLHTVSYQRVLAGDGFRLEDTRASIEVAHAIRNATPSLIADRVHPFVKPRR